MTPTVYRFDDAGAPQVVNGTPSEYMNIIKKCLVEGYGSKAALGWTVVDEDTTDAPFLALKNGPAGTGGVFMMDAPSNANNATFTVQCAIDYVDRTTFARVSRKTAQRNASAGTNMSTNWILIGTERCFYFICTSANNAVRSYFNGSSSQMGWFAGDVTPLINNDLATFTLLIGREKTTHDNNNNLLYHLNGTTGNNALSLSVLDGTDATLDHSLNCILGFTFYKNGVEYRTATPEIGLLADLYILASREVANSYFEPNVAHFPRLRAKLPGMRVTDAAGYMEQPFPFIKAINNKQHLLMPSTGGYISMVWLDLEDW